MSSEHPTVYKSDMMGYGLTGDNWAGPETWTEIPGVFSVELHRMSGAQSSWVQLKIASSTLPIEFQQRILIARKQITVGGVTITDPMALIQFNVDFVGRVDDVTPIHDEQYGQSWQLRCRDYMAVLQDNHIQRRSKNRRRRASQDTSTIELATVPADTWAPDWTNGGGGQPLVLPLVPNPNSFDGFTHDSIPYYRSLVAAELAMNFVDLPAGIRYVNIMQTPTAVFSGGPDRNIVVDLPPPFHGTHTFVIKPISHAETSTDKTILDAIRDILADDPWTLTGSQPIGSVDYPSTAPFTAYGPTAYDITHADEVGTIPGIGDEIIADYNPPLLFGIAGTSSVSGTPSADPAVAGPVFYTMKSLSYAGPYLRIFARGVLNFDQSMQFWYGYSGSYDNTISVGPGSVLRYPIMAYQFPKEGASLGTRGKLMGQGENSQDDAPWPQTFMKTASQASGAGSFVPVAPDYAGGAGGFILDNDDEVQWRTEAMIAAQMLPAGTPAHYASVRSGLSNDESLKGYPKVSGEKNPDGSYASLSAAANQADLLRALRLMARPSALRDLIRGSIVVPGLPRNSSGHPLITGVVIGVAIPPLFVNTTFYIVDSYVYTWPEDKTTIQLSRRPYDDLSDVVRNLRSSLYSAAAHGKSSYDSGWRLTSPTLTTTWDHNWGQRPTSFTITGAKAGGGTDQSGNPMPMEGTEVPLAFSMWDPQNGVYVGVALTASTDKTLTVAYAGNIAPCPAGGGSGWLLAGTDLIRLQVRG